MENPGFEGWCVLELMGHRKLGGYVREATIAGAPFVRVDVPAADPLLAGATQFYSPGSVYAITPCTEELARSLARSMQPAPVQTWELRPALPAQATYDTRGGAQYDERKE